MVLLSHLYLCLDFLLWRCDIRIQIRIPPPSADALPGISDKSIVTTAQDLLIYLHFTCEKQRPREVEACGPAHSGNNWKLGSNGKPRDPTLNYNKNSLYFEPSNYLKKINIFYILEQF